MEISLLERGELGYGFGGGSTLAAAGSTIIGGGASMYQSNYGATTSNDGLSSYPYSDVDPRTESG